MNAPANKPPESLSQSERVLSMIVALASGLVLGSILAFSEALRIKDTEFSSAFLVKTAVAFVLGFAVPFAYLSRILVHRERTSRLFARGGLIVNIILVLAGYIYASRINESPGRLLALAAALCFIGGGFTLIRHLVRAAEREEAEEEAKERAGSEDGAPRI
jgi:hypothetical protein